MSDTSSIVALYAPVLSAVVAVFAAGIAIAAATATRLNARAAVSDLDPEIDVRISHVDSTTAELIVTIDNLNRRDLDVLEIKANHSPAVGIYSKGSTQEITDSAIYAAIMDGKIEVSDKSIFLLKGADLRGRNRQQLMLKLYRVTEGHYKGLIDEQFDLRFRYRLRGNTGRNGSIVIRTKVTMPAVEQQPHFDT